jgi:hypothetical protein
VSVLFIVDLLVFIVRHDAFLSAIQAFIGFVEITTTTTTDDEAVVEIAESWWPIIIRFSVSLIRFYSSKDTRRLFELRLVLSATVRTETSLAIKLGISSQFGHAISS